MVEQFGKPHFFIALTIAEINSFHWEEIIDIEKIVEQLHASLKWEYFLVECVILFHTKV
jgi:hypothetical protein